MREKCSYSEFFWSVFYHNRTENEDLQNKFLYLVQMWENMDQINSEYGRFLRSAGYTVSKFPFTDLIRCMFKKRRIYLGSRILGSIEKRENWLEIG